MSTSAMNDQQTMDELNEFRAYLRTLPEVDTRVVLEAPALPFAPLPELDADTERAIKAAALVANERYLNEVIEEHSFCPFARGGRAQGLTVRFVHYFSGNDVAPLVEVMKQIAENPNHVITQVIFPMLEVSALDWMRFCQDVTRFCNAQLGTEAEVYAVAPLHPALPYAASNPFSLIPLFRRAPDPTIQWVRNDGLKGIYAGRERDTRFVDLDELDAFLEKKRRPPLFDYIAQTNLKMANRLGIQNVDRALAEVSQTAQKSYANILLGGAAAEPHPKGGCPVHASATPDVAPLQAQRSGEVWNLGAVRDFGKRVLHHVLVDGVDLVVVRIEDELHTLYGRCPHRQALLSHALLEGSQIVCPHHGWDFNLASGASEGVPGASVHRFESRVSEGFLWLDHAALEAWRAANPVAFTSGELVP
ncbi:MAG: hypothetical protein AUK47_23650 [Deltaproteobacteria bacterium CG2_30_63_29]|nr:MAG: hypothetical protein AUK47_23650 [Deltaproteobacteria bacterium CG2_30_63_29]